MHGGVPLSELGEENLFAVQAGFANVRQHVENMRKYGIPVVVAINKFVSDFSSELDSLTEMCADIEVPTATCEVFAKGGAGGTALGEEVLKILNLHEGGYVNLYDEDLPLKDKIARVVHEIYRGDYVKYSTRAAKQLVEFEQRSWGHLPVCIAKTQYSFSDNPKKLGAPQGFEIEVAELIPKLGAGYIVVRTGNTVTMPGLPKAPSGLKITLSDDGVIGGVS
jgi:formate--tetrahydrofolate ligase